MDTSNLSQLETRISKLLEMYQSLQSENSQLRRDRDSLIEKNKLASTKIEAMINRLKDMG
ncbi:cell division protein ZapB [Aliikangiella sp. IMCC44653]